MSSRDQIKEKSILTLVANQGKIKTMPRKQLTLHFIQNNIHEEQPEKNAEQILKSLQKIKLKKNDLVLLPEFFLGHTKNSKRRARYAEFYRSFNVTLCQAAKKNKIFIYGSFLNKQKKNYKNTAALYGSQGKILATYHKIHLFRYEGEHKTLRPGQKPILFKTPWGKVAPLICYDIRFPELLRELTWQGAKMAFVCAQWPDTRRHHWLTLLQARAIENQIFILACNRRGKKDSLKYAGDSVVVSPWGEILLHLKNQDAFGSCQIQIDDVDKIRKQYPFWRDAQKLGFKK